MKITDQIHVIDIGQKDQDTMALCKKTVAGPGLTPFAANPFVAKVFASSLTAPKTFGMDV